MKMKFLYLVFVATGIFPQLIYAQQQYTLSELHTSQGEVISDWISNNQAFTIQLKAEEAPVGPVTHSQFQVLIADNDVSTLFEFQQGQLVFSGGIPLPAGENNLAVKQFINGKWHDIGQSQIKIMTSSGFKQSQWSPKLELNINSQLKEKTSGDSTASERPTFSDVTARIGLMSHHENDDMVIDSNVNLLSVSNRSQAIQFGNKAAKASKLDVADYLVSVQKGNNKVSMGQVSYGNNALLVDNLSRRGITWQYQNEANSTINGAILNGSDIVGYNNFTGLANINKQYVKVLGFGFNTLTDSRISLRIEGNYLDAQRTSQNDFGIGEIASAEKNQGMAFKVSTIDSEGKLNADLTMGLSRYTNPDDNNLDFGETLVPLKTKTALAYNVNFSYILLQDWLTPWQSPMSFTLLANRARTEPLYQTLTAFVQANVLTQMVGGQYQIGNISGNISVQRAEDNLDKLVNILTTRTSNTNFSSTIPLAQIFNGNETDNSPNPWLPALDYSYQSTHQFAVNSPEASVSGFNGGSHLPDQITTTHTLSSNWQLDMDSISLQTSYSFQDNQQIGRELADFKSLQHALSYNLQQNDSTSWTFSISRNRQNDLENQKIQFNNAITISFNWQSENGLALNANYGLSKDDDSKKQGENTATNADIGLIKNLVKGQWWFPADGSISFRINYNDGRNIDRVFNLQNKFSTTTAQLGINLSFQ